MPHPSLPGDPSAPPMMPPGAPAPGGPPPMPPGGPPPPPEGGMPSPDAVRAQIEAALPEPDSGFYSAKLVGKVADAATKAMKALLPKEAAAFPAVQLPPGKAQGDRLPGKLPAEVMVPVLVLVDLVVSVGGPAGQRYAVESSELVNDDALEMLLAKLQAMAADKALKKAIAEAAGPPPKEKALPKAKQEPGMEDEASAPLPPPSKNAGAYL